MRYDTPEIKSVAINDLLTQIGPARALLYMPGGGDGGSGGGGDDEGGDLP